MKNDMPHLWMLFLLYLLLSPGFGAADWPQWRGPSRNGISHETGWNPYALENGAKILWKSQVGHGYGTVAVVGNRIFVMGSIKDSKDDVYCLDKDTGEEIWRFVYDCPNPNGCFESYKGPRSTPVWDESGLFVLSHQGLLHCLDAENGRILWKKDLENAFGAACPKYGFTGSPVIEGEYLVLNACKSGLVLDKRTGQKIWSSEKGRGSYSTPVIFSQDRKRYVLFFAYQRLVCRLLETGEECWHHPWPYVNNDGAASADPVVIGKEVFVSSAYRKGAGVIAFDAAPPEQCWFNRDVQNEFGSSIYADGCLFAPHGDTRHPTAYLRCVEWETGQILWSRDTGHCSLIRVDGKFIVLNQWGVLTVMQADREGYRDYSQAKVMETSRENRCWPAPVMAGGRIYIRSTAGNLVCVDMTHH